MTDTLDSTTGLPESSTGAALPGVLPAGVQPPNVPANATPAQEEAAAMAYYNANPQIQQAIQAEYGDMAWALQIPEVASIIITAGIYGWDQGKMDGAISATNWYKTASQSMRSWQATLASDPATAQQAIQTSMWQINQIETQLGLSLSVQQEQNLATQANMFNWSADQLTQIIANGYANQILTIGGTGANSGGVNEAGTAPGSSPAPTMGGAPSASGSGAMATAAGGTAGTFEQQAQALAGQYLIPVSPTTMQQWAAQAVKGQVNIDGFQNYLRQQAATLYPWMQPALEQGLTPTDYLNPYTQAMATTLAISPDQVDWTNPKTMALLTNTDSNGQQSIKNLSEFTTAVKQDPSLGYQNTQSAMDTTYSTIQTLNQIFGKTAS